MIRFFLARQIFRNFAISFKTLFFGKIRRSEWLSFVYTRLSFLWQKVGLCFVTILSDETLKKVTRGYKMLQGLHGLQAYRGLQVVTGCYKE